MKHAKTLLALLLCAALLWALGTTALAQETKATVWSESFESGLDG